MKAVLLLTTTSSVATAKTLAKKLLKQKLAACISFREGFVSFYEWKGKLEKQKETLVLIKSSRANLTRLEEAIKKVHPYDNPEILTIPISRVSSEYARWMKEVMK
jgi:periplasmic divalent cation tolerance protein